jgi:hypothetical protein
MVDIPAARRICMKWFAIVWCGVCVAGCSQAWGPKAERTAITSNKNYTLELLFTDENGAKIYRFTDAGEYQYYVVGPNSTQMLPTHTVRTEVVTVDTPVVVRGK